MWPCQVLNPSELIRIENEPLIKIFFHNILHPQFDVTIRSPAYIVPIFSAYLSKHVNPNKSKIFQKLRTSCNLICSFLLLLMTISYITVALWNCFLMIPNNMLLFASLTQSCIHIFRNILSQAEYLVDKMKKDKTVDFENDWKLVTLFIGGNDLCAFCKDEVTILSN